MPIKPISSLTIKEYFAACALEGMLGCHHGCEPFINPVDKAEMYSNDLIAELGVMPPTKVFSAINNREYYAAHALRGILSCSAGRSPFVYCVTRAKMYSDDLITKLG